MQILMQFWKRFVESVTSFAHKYRFEPFFKTTINIIALLASFSVAMLVLVAMSVSFLYQDTSNVILEGIERSVTTPSSPDAVSVNIATKMDHLSNRNTLIVIATILIITIAFGYLVARIALTPTRNALQSQKQFIGNIAHELRTPLSTIKTNTEVALFDQNLNQGLREMLEDNVAEMDRISDIINNLLSFNRSFRPELVPFSTVDLGTTVEIARQKLRQLADRKLLEVSIRMSEQRLVRGNATALEQIVSNILKNAIIYTPNKGRIGITVEPMGPNMIELTIEDSGSGISRKDLFHIFEPFYRAEPSRHRTSSGSGLGLTIVNELVKLHNGKIKVKSMEGRGTTVTVMLPAAQQDRKNNDSKVEMTNEVAIDYSKHASS